MGKGLSLRVKNSVGGLGGGGGVADEGGVIVTVGVGLLCDGVRTEFALMKLSFLELLGTVSEEGACCRFVCCGTVVREKCC